MAGELLHESLQRATKTFSRLASPPSRSNRGSPTHVAESTDLAVALALGVKVGSTLSSSHVETSERILEDLLKAKELEDGEVDGRVKAKSSLRNPATALARRPKRPRRTSYLVRAEDGGELEGKGVVSLEENEEGRDGSPERGNRG